MTLTEPRPGTSSAIGCPAAVLNAVAAMSDGRHNTVASPKAMYPDLERFGMIFQSPATANTNIAGSIGARNADPVFRVD